MTSLATPEQRSSRPVWHTAFSQTILYFLAPAVLLFSGFFTANFLLSGLYTWPRTSRVFALTVTLLILAYEFVYKEQQARLRSHDRALYAVLYSCLVPYVVGVLIMLGLTRL